MKNIFKLIESALSMAFIVLAASITVLMAGCDNDGGGQSTPSGSTWGNPPSELTGTWLSMGVSPLFTINADGTGTLGASPVDSWKVKGSELRLIISGVVTTVSWNINGGTLTLSDPSSGPMATTLKSYSDLGLSKQAGTGGISYSVKGNSASSATTTSSLTFTFNTDPGTLTAGEINVSGAASRGNASLSGSGKARTLSPITVSATGIATVSIGKDGIETGTKNVQVYKKGDSGANTPQAQLVAKWYNSQDSANTEDTSIFGLAFEFFANGNLSFNGIPYTYSYTATETAITTSIVTAGVTVPMGNTTYSINGTELTIDSGLIDDTFGGDPLYGGTYYKKGNLNYIETGGISSSTAQLTP